ncbi:transglutaminase family protein [Delftia tsuruhatensis]
MREFPISEVLNFMQIHSAEMRFIYDVRDASGADFIFGFPVAADKQQVVFEEVLKINQPLEYNFPARQRRGNRVFHLHAKQGHFELLYKFTFSLRQRVVQPCEYNEVPIGMLPSSALAYLYPSRYCQSDKMAAIAYRNFGKAEPGLQRIAAIRAWVGNYIAYYPATGSTTTSALDTMIDRAGGGREIAHLTISFLRALNIPSRLVTGISFIEGQSRPMPAFHACVEAFLSGGWVLLDPINTGDTKNFVRIGRGRDAADTAYATIFGSVISMQPTVSMDSGASNLPNLASYPFSGNPVWKQLRKCSLARHPAELQIQ